MNIIAKKIGRYAHNLSKYFKLTPWGKKNYNAHIAQHLIIDMI